MAKAHEFLSGVTDRIVIKDTPMGMSKEQEQLQEAIAIKLAEMDNFSFDGLAEAPTRMMQGNTKFTYRNRAKEIMSILAERCWLKTPLDHDAFKKDWRSVLPIEEE